MEEMLKEKEVIVISGRKPKGKAGQTGTVALMEEGNPALQTAVSYMARYLSLAGTTSWEPSGRQGFRLEDKNPVILVGTISCLRREWIPKGLSASQLGPEDAAWGKSPGGRPGAVITGKTPGGVQNSLYAFLSETIGARWFQPRFPSKQTDGFLEIHLRFQPSLKWPERTRVIRPAMSVRGILFPAAQLSESGIRWCAANCLNTISLGLGHQFPLPADTSERLKQLIPLAQQYGLKVLLSTFPHIVSSQQAAAHPGILADGKVNITLPETLRASTELHLRLLEEYGADGFDWHPSSEGIRLNYQAPGFEKRSRIEWEALFVNAHCEAIRKVNPEAVLALVCGWNYVNPASQVRKLFYPGIIARPVPVTEIIGYRMCDLKSYQKHFPKKCWYWLYADVSASGGQPMPALDYLCRYAKDAVATGNGFIAQFNFCSRAVINAEYLLRAGWHGPEDPDRFLDAFLPAYFGSDRTVHSAVKRYIGLIPRFRNYLENIQISPLVYLTDDEAEEPVSIYRGFLQGYRSEPLGIHRDRIKE